MACVGSGNISSWQFGLPMKQEPMDSDSGITSSPGSDTHDNRYPEDSQDHLRRLEISLEKGMFSMDESSNKSENEESDDPAKLSKTSHGKAKTYKCKQCKFMAASKEDYWEHQKIHIKAEKRLSCPKCPFITEYKHHLEYHLRNHSGSRPFKCTECEYSCVCKSMLNSHMKSHSNVYRYRCADCSYATKYCHSLKIHLKKYSHQPDVVLDDSGKPCPDIIIDVYGTRRGPKLKTQQSIRPEQSSPIPQNDIIPFGLNLMAAAAAANPQFPCYPFFANPQLVHNFQQMVMERHISNQSPEEPRSNEHSALDLSKPSTSEFQPKNRRKGPAFKLGRLENESEDEESETTMFGNVETVVGNQDEKEDRIANNNNKGEDNTTCQYCSITFGDPVLYTMHMGYHGFNNPFTCNMCGVECGDKVTFFLHIARTPHL